MIQTLVSRAFQRCRERARLLARTVLVVSAFPVPSEKLYDAACADTSTQGPDHNHSDCQTATPQTTQTRQTRQTFRAEGGGALPRLYATLEAIALPPTVMLAALTSGARLNRRILEDVADCTSARKSPQRHSGRANN